MKPGEAGASGATSPHHVVYHLGFETADLAAQLAKMKARGVNFLIPLTEKHL